MNFKIEEESEETQKKKSKNTERIMLIIIIIISLVCGLTVFLISNAIFGKKKPVEVVDTNVNISEETVQILYSYVAHDSRNKNDDKFLMNKSVTQKDFTNKEKYNYALQFVQPSDLRYINEFTDNKEKIYVLDEKKVESFMKRFFGSQMTYENEKNLTYAFDFSINGKNLGNLEYSSKDKGYRIYFPETEDNSEEDMVEPYYTELYEAIRKVDGSMILKEKVIYTELKEIDGRYEIDIYKDYQKTNLIEKKTNLSLDELKNTKIQMNKYKDTAGTISYVFKVENLRFYFYSSTISN